MKKLCVFCGEKPTSKSREHVIPRWLIALTGEMKRPFHIGPLMGRPQLKSVPFDALTFPACKSCNERFAAIESPARKIVSTLLTCGDLSCHDFHALLDWLDKVRVGLWLGCRYLDNNPFGIDPKFAIEQRIGTRDRTLIVTRLDQQTRRLGLIGPGLPLFQHQPCCFSMLINSVSLLSGCLTSYFV